MDDCLKHSTFNTLHFDFRAYLQRELWQGNLQVRAPLISHVVLMGKSSLMAAFLRILITPSLGHWTL